MADDKQINNFPSPFATPEEKKQDKYGIEEARAIWAAYTKNQVWWNGRRQRDITNRKYAEGLESIEKYKDRLDLSGDASYLNLDFTPTTRIANLKDNVVGRMMAQEYKIQCNPIDSASKTQEDDDRKEMYTNMFLKKASDVVEKETGIPLVPKDKKIPESDEEAELFFKLNYKQQSSIAMEEALEAVFYNTKFEETKKKILTDLVVLKKAAIRVHYDEDYNILPSYEDPVDVITPYSKYDDFRNVPYEAVIRKYTIGEIAQMTDKFSDEKLYDIAKSYAGKNENAQWNNAWGNTYEGYYWNTQGSTSRPYDDYNISVLEFYFLTINKHKYEKKETFADRFYFNKKKSDYEPPKDSKYKREIINKNIQYRYEGKWIIGSDYIYDYKMSENIERKKVMGAYSPKTELPIIMIYPEIYDMENKSIVERLIPHEDRINLINLKRQQFLIKAVPPGLAIDLEGLENVTAGIGKGDTAPIEITKMYEQTGNYIFRSRDKAGNVINSSVITPLQNGIARDFYNLVNEYNFELQQMNDVIGYNTAVDGSTPDPKTLVGVQKLAVNGTNSSLRPLNFSYIRLIERVAERLSLMIQDSIEFSNEAFSRSIGRQATEIIKYGKKIALKEFGIKIQLLPDEAERAQIEILIQTALANKEIKTSDAVIVRQVLKQNVKLAEQMLVLKENKNFEQRQVEAQNNAQMNGEEQAKAGERVAQANQQSEAAIAQLKQQLLTTEYTLKGQLSAQEHKQRLEEIALQNVGKVNTAHATSDGKVIENRIKQKMEKVAA